jgi:hypothetical protein
LSGNQYEIDCHSGILSENHLSQSHYLVVIIQTVSAFCIVFGFG